MISHGSLFSLPGQITVWKRYSDFRRLHQNLLQLHKNVCSQSELFPPFAKAKVFGKKDQPEPVFVFLTDFYY